MADIEQRVENLETRFMTVERHVDQVMTKLDMFIEESREIRRRQDADRQRHDDEIRELLQRQDAAQTKHDDDMREICRSIDSMDVNIDSMERHIRNKSFVVKVDIVDIVAVLGIAAMVVAVFLK